MGIHGKSFLAGTVFMLVIAVSAGWLWENNKLPGQATPAAPVKTSETAIPPDAVKITPLPTLRMIGGTDVAFKGKVTLRQAIAGRFAKNLVIVNFQAKGDHADKSMIRIVWENGEVETIAPGVTNRKFPLGKNAVEISVIGYSMQERPIFHDLPRPGSLTWEIRYEPVE
ncbi:Hypothetical protein LUCI_4480 [Lucifera butyrica]|uniref:Uncharacterized protein n=1 Tax=Lucifera butyrica TaxID=1351585 RepID=A0A498RCD5_9FIRM|nr:hypothetical protein [Lucifera butyrica]VBB09194.1 Hypothetical protein LUCI_4480 [Lucifera butyrica]